MKLLGTGAALAIAGQVAYFTWPDVHGLVGAVIAVLLAAQIWAARRYLNEHVDMLVLMTGYGGLGMLAGPASCHLSLSGWLTMTAGMLVLGVPPVLFGSRCLMRARREGHFAMTLSADIAGMMIGMLLAQVAMPSAVHSPMLHHVSMVLGMIAGMGGANVLVRPIRSVKRSTGQSELPGVRGSGLQTLPPPAGMRRSE